VVETGAFASKLAAALVQAQPDLKAPAFDSQSTAYGGKPYRYASLSAVVAVVRPALAKHGLGVIQLLANDGPDLLVTTRLVHSSGETIESTQRAPCPAKPQDRGGVITYLRRYGLNALLCLAAEEDDDAGAAQEAARTPVQASEAPRGLPAPASGRTPQKAAKGLRMVSGVCAGVESKVSKAGKAYWRIGIEAGDGIEWFTTFKEQREDALKGKRIDLTLEDREKGPVCVDVWESEEVPF
jgi:hypothetical protein